MTNYSPATKTNTDRLSANNFWEVRFQSQMSALLEDSAWEYNPRAALKKLYSHLQRSENLTLGQYEYVRALVGGKDYDGPQGIISEEETYASRINSALRSGVITQSEAQRINKSLTDYLRNTHSGIYCSVAHKSSRAPTTVWKREESKPGILSQAFAFARGVKNSVEYMWDWKKKDTQMYQLERMLINGESPQGGITAEKDLVNSVPIFGLSKHKKATLERMVNSTRYPNYLSRAVGVKEERKGFFTRAWETVSQYLPYQTGAPAQPQTA
ncbi:MAG: hypothetical protein WC796_05195 [Candidatus Pacearchaeota archaeon]|jgi:hypothetical protein